MISKLKKIRRDFLKRSRFNDLVRKVDISIIKSSDFKKNDIVQCFKERKVVTTDPAIIDRIISAFNKAKMEQKKYPTAFQIGNEWLPIYERYMNDIIQALGNSSKDEVNKIYENFMREDCSVGLHGMSNNMFETYFIKKISSIDRDTYLYDALYRYKHWRKLTEDKYQPSDLEMAEFGNSYGYYIDGKYIRTGAEYLHYYATRISNLIASCEQKKVVVELGGGYGGMGYFLNKINDDLTYVDVDLPENMALTAYYLMNCFPDKKTLLYGEEEFNEQSFDKYDIIIMPNFEISKLPTQKANLVFNSYSLAEMSSETINTYIPELKRASNQYFFHVNHSVVSHSLKADEFGIDDNDYKLISKQPALWNMGRNIEMDEYEYLYAKSLTTESSIISLSNYE